MIELSTFSAPANVRRHGLTPALALLAGVALASFGGQAQQRDDERELPAPAASSKEEIVRYPVSFFARYSPNTALDMVKQIPGFQVDNGGNKRGFGGALGNILINDRRPSAKQDLPSAILGRIPAGNVARIELIRGQVRGIDLQGQTVVANVILRDDVPASVRWELYARHTFGHGLAPGGSISLSDRLGDIEYNVGIDGRYSNFGDSGPEEIFDGDGLLIRERYEDDGGPGFEGYDLNTYLNAATWFGETFVQLNTKVNAAMRDELLLVTDTPLAPEQPHTEVIDTERRALGLELGLDAERLLSEDLLGKGIFLLFLSDQYPSSGRRDYDVAGDPTLFRVIDTDTFTLESIGRTEFTWAGWQDHSIQLNLEVAYNALDNGLLQTDHTAAGVETIDIPGSDSKVEEIRGDIMLNDTWTLDLFSVEFGLGAETSEISQTGDAELERSYFFVKPYANFTYAPNQRQQTRVEFGRDVSQLDFNDFVSATVFRDDELFLGNPNLNPETTWQAALTHERRFSELGVVSVTGFHDWITDVEDLLPITAEFEAPGNIGKGRRWGLELESTLPLEWLGLDAARLDVKARWQDSSVTDPVTGLDRELSGVEGLDPEITFFNDNDYAYIVSFRQDIQQSQVSWGADIGNQSERIRFKVNELDIRDEGYKFNMFVETTRWLDLKIRLDAFNILNYGAKRERITYLGQRGLSGVDVIRRQVLRNGARLNLAISGSF